MTCSRRSPPTPRRSTRSPPSPTPRSRRSETPARSTPPATREEEWALVRKRREGRRVGRADLRGPPERRTSGSRSTGSTPRTTCSACGAPIRRPARASRPSVEGDELHGVKMFCSGAGGLDRALVIARGHARLRRPRTTTSRSTRPGTAPAGCGRRRATASSSTARAILATLGAAHARAVVRARRDPHRRRLGGHRSTRRSRRRWTTSRQAGDRRPASARGGADRHRPGHDRPLVRARGAPAARRRPQRLAIQLRAGGRRGRARRSSTRPRARPARARSRPARRWTARAATSSCSCCSTGSTRSSPALGADRGARGSASVSERLRPAFFDDLYARDPDPWDFETSAYERGEVRRDDRGARRPAASRSALEIGCSIGVLTAAARAARATSLLGDRRRRGRARTAPATRVPEASASSGARSPRSSPTGAFDLIVVLRGPLLPRRAAFEADAGRDRAHAQPGTLLAVHWRPTHRSATRCAATRSTSG